MFSTAKELLSNLPVAINNYYGDPLLPFQLPDTLKKLSELDSQGHKGIVGIITKSRVSRQQAREIREAGQNLKLVVLMSVSGLPEYIEPAPATDIRLTGMENLLSEGVPVMGYLRPFIPPYNTSPELIRNIIRGIAQTGTKCIVVAGFRGNDQIVTSVNPQDREKWLIRVKIMPKQVNDVIQAEALKHNITIRHRTSCGLAVTLGLNKSHNPYYISPQLAGCNDCNLHASCSAQPVLMPDTLEFLQALGYMVNYKEQPFYEKCTVQPDNRPQCPSCCTACYIVNQPRLEVSNPGITLGDLAFIRFVTGILAVKPKVVDTGKPDVASVTFPVLSTPPAEIHCLNTWYVWSANAEKCFGCKYCITQVYGLKAGKSYGMSPVALAEWIASHRKTEGRCK